MIWSLPQDEESGNLKEAVRSIETKLDRVAHSPSAGSEEQSTQDATPAHGKRRNAYSDEFKIAPVDHAAVTEAHDADEPAPDDTGDATSKPSADVQPSAGLEDDTLEDYSAQTPVSVAKTHPKEASHHDQELYKRGETQFATESKSTASKPGEKYNGDVQNRQQTAAIEDEASEHAVLEDKEPKHTDCNAASDKSSLKTNTDTSVATKDGELDSGQPESVRSSFKEKVSSGPEVAELQDLVGGEDQASAVRNQEQGLHQRRKEHRWKNPLEQRKPQSSWDALDGGCTPQSRYVDRVEGIAPAEEIYTGWNSGLRNAEIAPCRENEAEISITPLDSSDAVASDYASTAVPQASAVTESRNEISQGSTGKSIRQLKRELHQAECDAAGRYNSQPVESLPDPRPTHVPSKVVVPEPEVGDATPAEQTNKETTSSTESVSSVHGDRSDRSISTAKSQSDTNEPIQVGTVKPPTSAPLKGMPQSTGIHKHFNDEGGPSAPLSVMC